MSSNTTAFSVCVSRANSSLELFCEPRTFLIAISTRRTASTDF